MIEERRLYDNYIRFYKERDFIKASEFVWGAINNLAYAIGPTYGKRLRKHGETVQFLRELAKANGRGELREYINSAEALHANFYHGWMDEEVFEENARKVEELRKWLV